MDDSAPSKTKKPRRPSVSDEVWEQMLAAYRDEPTIKHVMEATGVGKRVARRAIQEGWPDHGLSPFRELDHSQVATLKEAARYRQRHEDGILATCEATRIAAEETMAARIVMDAALKSMRVSQEYAAAALKWLQDNKFPMPEDGLEPKHIAQLVKSLRDSTETLHTALEIIHQRTGRPGDTLNLNIAVLLDQCADEDLEEVAATGHVPGRVLDHRSLVRAQLTASDMTDGEEAAQASIVLDEDGMLVQGVDAPVQGGDVLAEDTWLAAEPEQKLLDASTEDADEADPSDGQDAQEAEEAASG